MEKETAGGGALIDLGVHGMSLLPFFANGSPTQVSALMKEWKNSGSDSAATIMVEFENETIGVAHTNMITSIMQNNLEILGTRGQILVVENDLYLNSLEIDGYNEGITLIDPEEYVTENVVLINWFIDFVLDKDNNDQYLPYVGIDDAMTVVQIIETTYESSAQEGQAVQVRDISE